MAKRDKRKISRRTPVLSPIIYSKGMPKKKKTIAKIPPGKKPREYDLIRLDDLGGLLFPPIKALAIIAEEIRDKALAEIAGKRDLKEELLHLRMLYESGMITKEEYEKRAKEVTAKLEAVKEHNKSKKNRR
ncbi:MAG: gas vesicle protein GvpG [bacterium]|nr:gas vesicle protein GvpG [bacterium]